MPRWDGERRRRSGQAAAPALVPAPWALVAVALLGLVAVIQLPEMASLLPYGDRPEPNEAQLAITALGLIALTAAYLYVAWNVARLSPAWAGLIFAYNAAIVVAKFILSPAALHNAPGTTLAQHVWVGMAVLLLYVAGLVSRLRRRPAQPGAGDMVVDVEGDRRRRAAGVRPGQPLRRGPRPRPGRLRLPA